MYLRKFYDTGVSGKAGAAERPTIVAEYSPSQVIDMYQGSGVPSQETPKETPKETPAPSETPVTEPVEKPAEPKPVAPEKTVTPTTEEPKPAKPSEPTEAISNPGKTVTPVQETVAPPAPAVKKPLSQVLKEEYGIDDFGIKALEFYKETGDLTPYIKVKSIDYKNMAPEEVMRHDLQEQYPELDAEALDVIYREDVAAKYLLDPESHSEAEVKAAKARLVRAAEPLRKKFLEYQEQFQAPQRNTEAEQQAAAQAQKAALDQRNAYISNNPVTQKFLADKRLVIPYGENGEQFTFEVPDPSDVLQTITNDQKWIQETHEKDANGKLIVDANGNYVPSTKHMLEAVAFKKYISQIVKQAREEGVAEGNKKFVMEATNPDSEVAAIPGDTEETLAQAFKKRGVKRNW